MNRDALVEEIRPLCGPLAEAAVDAVLAGLGIARSRTDDQQTVPPPAGLPDGVDGYRLTGRAA